MDIINVPVAGIPFSVSIDSNGQYVTASTTRVTLNEAPLEIMIDPPIGPVGEASLPSLVSFLTNRLAAAILMGAIID